MPDWLDPMLAHLRSAGAFAAKIGPPIWTRRWGAATLKDAIAAGEATALRDITADETDGRALAAADVLEAVGWTQKPSTGRRVRRRAAALRLPGPPGRAHRGRPAHRVQPAVAAQHQEGRQGRGHGPPGRRRRPAHVPRGLRRDRRARPVHPPRPALLPADVDLPARGGPRPDLAVPRRARGHLPRRDDRRAGQPARLVLLRGLHDRRPRPAAQQRDPVADDPRRARHRGRHLRHARHHRHTRPRRPPVRPAAVQGRHRGVCPGVRRGMGLSRSARRSPGRSRPTCAGAEAPRPEDHPGPRPTGTNTHRTSRTHRTAGHEGT